MNKQTQKKMRTFKTLVKACEPLRNTTTHHPSNGVILRWDNLRDSEDFRLHLQRMQLSSTQIPDREPQFTDSLEQVTLLLLKAMVIKHS